MCNKVRTNKYVVFRKTAETYSILYFGVGLYSNGVWIRQSQVDDSTYQLANEIYRNADGGAAAAFDLADGGCGCAVEELYTAGKTYRYDTTNYVMYVAC